MRRYDVLLPASHPNGCRARRSPRGVTVEGVTTVHPVRSAPLPVRMSATRAAFPSPSDRPWCRRGVLPGADLLASVLARTAEEERPVTHVHHVPVRQSSTLPWPDWVSPALRDRLEERGVRARGGTRWTPRSSPTTAGTWWWRPGRRRGSRWRTSFRRSPGSRRTPAPACSTWPDQGAGPRPARLGGGPGRSLGASGRLRRGHPGEERDWVRRHSRWIVTNPDMLHRGIRPPTRSGPARCGGWPTSSSTSATPTAGCSAPTWGTCCAGSGGSAVATGPSRCSCWPRRPWPTRGGREPVVGAPVEAVTHDGSPRPGATFALWEPPLTERTGEHGAPLRRSAAADAATLLADLVERGARTLAFVRSRRGAESVADQARRILHDRGRDDLIRRVDSYRGGYLPEERRELERALSAGHLLGVATTNAPGARHRHRRAGRRGAGRLSGHARPRSGSRRAGRGGRRRSRSSSSSPATTRWTTTSPTTPVPCSAADRGHRHRPGQPLRPGPPALLRRGRVPLRPADLDDFGGPVAEAQLEELVAAGQLRRRPAGWYWAGRGRPDVDIRGSGGEPVSIIEAETGRLLGTVDADAAHSTVHDGALYVHRGTRSSSTSSTSRTPAPWCTPRTPSGRPSPATSPISASSRSSTPAASVRSPPTGVLDVTNQVVAYQRAGWAPARCSPSSRWTSPPGSSDPGRVADARRAGGGAGGGRRRRTARLAACRRSTRRSASCRSW